jgi:hypothetical protein
VIEFRAVRADLVPALAAPASAVQDRTDGSVMFSEETCLDRFAAMLVGASIARAATAGVALASAKHWAPALTEIACGGGSRRDEGGDRGRVNRILLMPDRMAAFHTLSIPVPYRANRC